MAICMDEPHEDRLAELARELARRPRRQFPARQVKARGGLLGTRYEPPWWYWLGYFRANRN